MNRLRTALTIVVLFPVGCFSQESSSGKPIEVRKLKEYLPQRVNVLAESLDRVSLAGQKNVADANDRYVRRAKEEALRWVFKTVRKDWLPPDPNVLRSNLVMLKDAVGPNDLAIVRWQKGDNAIAVAQTKTIILIQVRPTSESIRAETAKGARKLLARNTTLSVLNREVDVRVVEPTKSRMEKRIITPDLSEASFEFADVQEYAEGIHGMCAGPRGDRDRDFGYWWRRVSWWTDGRAINIYALKTEGGAWRANYGETILDAKWFEEPEPLISR